MSAPTDIRSSADTEPLLSADAGMDRGDREWFKKAVFYEVMVRSFRDSNDDGVGDFAGLAEKLDYLQWLGVDCLWLPPFFGSPLLDGGYDVSDYTTVLPELGTVAEFRSFVEGAHERGIRIIIDFVMNHTSDQHPWFQQSRSDPDGPYGDYYVWADGGAQNAPPEAYAEARIIFVDTEVSNWTYDEARGQYFWHRFYSHRAMLVIRRNHPVFGLGTFTDLGGANDKVFSFLRSHRDEMDRSITVLCVYNLSPEPQTARLDLSRFGGLVPFDLLRDDEHHRIDADTAHAYPVEVAGHGFLWLRIMADDPELTEPARTGSAQEHDEHP